MFVLLSGEPVSRLGGPGDLQGSMITLSLIDFNTGEVRCSLYFLDSPLFNFSAAVSLSDWT